MMKQSGEDNFNSSIPILQNTLEEGGERVEQRLNMEFVSKVYLGCCVQLYSLAETLQLPPPRAFGLIKQGCHWSARIDDISV